VDKAALLIGAAILFLFLGDIFIWDVPRNPIEQIQRIID
tara:strand:- start:782 stop:898 length:117 start_codon:yes stop_codon:yes gene_type:complete